MEDIQEQLASCGDVLRISTGSGPAIGRNAARVQPDLRPARYFVEELISGEVVQTALGQHFETEKLFERHRRHGSMDISSLHELPEDLLDSLSDGAIPSSHPTEWAFLDTETTGLAGGTGTYAFLIGVGQHRAGRFSRCGSFSCAITARRLRCCARLSEHLAQFDVLITYNGKTYDQPLLETRFRMARARHPFARLAHLDLLFGARRLWKLRLESCRLVELENRILGVERQGDLPGEMIPYYYFEYLRTQQAFRLVPVFHHNAIDILSLACLTAMVPFAFRAPEETAFRHGADVIGLARWVLQAGGRRRRCACSGARWIWGLPDDLLFRTLWDIGTLEKRLGRADAALAVFTELAACRNAYRARALRNWRNITNTASGIMPWRSR